MPFFNGDEYTYDRRFLGRIIENTRCSDHRVDLGQSCFTTHSAAGAWLVGVCNKRALKAGYNAPVSDRALQLNRPSRGKRS